MMNKLISMYTRHVQGMSNLGGIGGVFGKFFVGCGYRGGIYFDEETRKKPVFGLNLTKLTLILYLVDPGSGILSCFSMLDF